MIEGGASSRAVLANPPYVCPLHGAKLDRDGEGLRCPEGHSYDVREAIPRFISGVTYADAFGYQWKRFRRTQLDSVTKLSLSRERLRRCLGPGWTQLRGASVLEAGCGAGRFTEILLDEGSFVTSVDLSPAVEANATNFPPGPRHRIAQADIVELPFGPRQYDFVICLGAVQHTPDPEATIAALHDQVRPGGWLVIDHYTLDLAALTRVGQVLRQVFKRLPSEKTLAYVERMVDRLLPVHRRLSRYGRLVSRVSPVLSYYHVHPELPENLQREWAILDTHDTLTDRYKHYRSPRAIRRLFDELGLEQVEVARAGNGVEARGRRPAPNAGANRSR